MSPRICCIPTNRRGTREHVPKSRPNTDRKKGELKSPRKMVLEAPKRPRRLEAKMVSEARNDVALHPITVYEQSCRAIADSEVRLWRYRFCENQESASQQNASSDEEPTAQPSPSAEDKSEPDSLEVEIQDAIRRKERDVEVLELLACRATARGMSANNLAEYGEKLLLIYNVKDAVKGYRSYARTEDCRMLDKSLEINGFRPEDVQKGILTSKTKIAGTLLRLIPAYVGFKIDDEGRNVMKFLQTLAGVSLDAPSVGPFRTMKGVLDHADQSGIPASKLAAYWRVYQHGSFVQESMRKEESARSLEAVSSGRNSTFDNLYISQREQSTKVGDETLSEVSDEDNCLQLSRDILERQLVRDSFVSETFWSELESFQSLGGDVADVQMFKKEGSKQVSRTRLNHMLREVPFPLAAFKKELSVFQNLGGHADVLWTYQQEMKKYTLQNRLDSMLQEDPFQLQTFRHDLFDLQDLGGHFSLMSPKSAETQLSKAVHRSGCAPTVSVRAWKNTLMVHGSNPELVSKTEVLLVRMHLKKLKALMEDGPLSDHLISSFRAAIVLATERSLTDLTPYETCLDEKELAYRMQIARSVVASYMQWTDVGSLKVGREDLTRAIEASQSRVAAMQDEMQQLLVHRRRIHNRLEDCKGKIRIYVRIRPATKSEHAVCVPFDDMGVRVLEDEVAGGSSSVFQFDACFAPGSQETIFGDVADLLQSCLDGYRCAILAYGQTGSGKTHTMMGSPSDPGITMRAGEHLFRLIREQQHSSRCTVYCCMYEIYRKQVVDLIAPPENKQKIVVGFDDARGQVTVDGVLEREITSPADLEALILDGIRRRKVAATAMNSHSSRSHALVQVRVVSQRIGSTDKVEGKMVLVDLAGSERLKKSAVSNDAAEDAIQINLSLTALGDMIHAVATGSKNIPYRSHVITKLLRDSLGGSAKTLLLVNVSPSEDDRVETLQSLRWASKAKNIPVTPRTDGAAKRSPRRSPKDDDHSPKRRTVLTVDECGMRSSCSTFSLSRIASHLTFSRSGTAEFDDLTIATKTF